MYDDNWFAYPGDALDWDFDNDFYDDSYFEEEVDLGVTDDNWFFGTLEVD